MKVVGGGLPCDDERVQLTVDKHHAFEHPSLTWEPWAKNNPQIPDWRRYRKCYEEEKAEARYPDPEAIERGLVKPFPEASVLRGFADDALWVDFYALCESLTGDVPTECEAIRQQGPRTVADPHNTPEEEEIDEDELWKQLEEVRMRVLPPPLCNEALS